MTTIGQQLQHARLALDLSVEDVAFRTRIPAGQVRDMENDDLSHFANLTYARGFLKLYSQFLGLDIAEHLSQFSTQEFSHASGHEYVQTAKATMNLPAAVFTDYGRARRPGLYLLLMLALAAGGVIWWNNYREEETSGSGAAPNTETPPGLPTPATASAEEKGTASPAPAPETSPPPAAATVPNPTPPAVPAVRSSQPPEPPAIAEPPTTAPALPAKPPKAVVVEDGGEPAPPPKRRN